MGIGGIWQWVIVLIVILLLFGTKRLRNFGSDLGHAVKGFRKGMQAETEKIADDAPKEGADAGKDVAPASEKTPAGKTGPGDGS